MLMVLDNLGAEFTASFDGHPGAKFSSTGGMQSKGSMISHLAIKFHSQL
ncbi:protein of unknown function [Methylotuvimicrobium alcaliphilum 20Z]|uniref:Uncharacterized protein n=1 Tax=Methylotuvimicrobium alcaliphilum (strain DSM 19304 / NCIMB 14124 / VKM B-2133 / 20Z) TaxID=1091494 RepID=G4SXY2_META2|nr:protein of unknown function [Methylotuvimicrobium alcaliphilum 20Z]